MLNSDGVTSVAAMVVAVAPLHADTVDSSVFVISAVHVHVICSTY